MKFRERIIIYGMGFLIGCMILGYSSHRKKTAAALRDEQDAAQGYAQETRMLPGHDFYARIPMIQSEDMLVFKDSAIDETQNQLVREIVADNKDENERVRYIERVWVDPETGRERLVSRQRMIADRVLVRLKNPNDLQKLKTRAQTLGYTYHKQGRNNRLHEIAIGKHDLEAFSKAQEVLSAEADIIEAALPIYLYKLSM